MSEKRSRVSPRKIAANRQNAVKSTGPKTAQGKAYSRNNALKHGLFAMDILVGGPAQNENARQYQELLDQLKKDYQPVGAAEKLEVARIAACWWRLERAWRFENAHIACERCRVDARLRERLNPKRPVQAPLSDELAAIDLLERAAADLGANGKISDELKREMTTANARFQEIWPRVEKLAEKDLSDFMDQRSTENQLAPTDPDDATRFLLSRIRTRIYLLEHRLESYAETARQYVFNSAVLPKEEDLDRLLRVEATAEKNLNRAIDRLERLQRRRLGESVPPPVRVLLTR